MYKHLLFSLIIITTFTLTLGESNSQDTPRHYRELRFEHITSQDGLASDVTTTIMQDSRGFMWFGTEAGLSKYDGLNFTNYNTSAIAENTQLSNNVIKCVYEDDNKNIWIGTEYGLNLLHQSTGQISQFINNREIKNSISNNVVTSIGEDAEGNIWVGTLSGLNRIKYNNQSKSANFDHFKHSNSNANSLCSDRIYSIFVDQQQNLWFCTEGGGISILENVSIKNEDYTFIKLNHVPQDEKSLSNDVVYQLAEMGDGTFYAATDRGLNEITWKQGQKPYVSRQFFKNTTKNNWLQDNRIFSLLVDEYKNLWVGTFSKGLFFYDKKNNEFDNYIHNPLLPQSISRNFVNQIYQSKEGIIWTSSAGGGIDKVNLKNLNFEHITANPAQKLSLSDPVVKSIIEGKNGLIWMGTNGGGVNIYDPLNKSIEYLKHPNSGESASNNIVQTITFDNDDTNWIGTMGSGLIEYNNNTKKTINHLNTSNDSNTIVSNFVWALYYSEIINSMFIGTYDGLSVYNKDTQTFRNFKSTATDPHSLSFNYIRTLHVDTNNTLWIGTYGGGLNTINISHLMNRKDVNFEHFRHQLDDKTSLSSDLVNSIFEDSKNRLWIATQNGLNLYHKEQNQFQAFTMTDGLPDNVIKAILEDKNGRLWVSTQNGISRFNTENASFINFTTDDGLPNNIFNLSSALNASSGNMYFGSIAGVCSFNPVNIKTDTILSPTVISNIYINGKRQLPDQKTNETTLINKKLKNIETIRLKHDENNVTFEFESAVLSSLTKTKFAYKLEGLDENWRNANHQNRNLTYNNLPHGKHIFRVKILKENGIEGQEATIQLIIQKHPARSNKAILLYIIILIGSTYLVIRITKTQYKVKHELLLEKEQSKRQNELNTFKQQFFTNISHELRTPLSLISGPLQKLKAITHNESKTAHRYISIIEKHSDLMLKLINQLLDFQKASSNKLKLNITQSDIITQLNNISRSFEEFALDKNIFFSFKPPSVSYISYFDQDKIDKVLYNLVSNAFKYTQNGGTIRLSISTPKHKKKWEANALRSFDLNKDTIKMIYIRVKDNGIGIDNHDDRVFDRFFQASNNKNTLGTGIGLAYSNQLMKVQQGYIGFDSKPGKGSAFYIAFPSEKTAYPQNSLIHNESLTLESSTITTPRRYVSLENKIETTDAESEILIPKTKLLIVEDNIDVLNFTTEIFSDQFIVLKAKNGKEGFAKVVKESPDIIISDVMMPVMDGLDFCKLVKNSIETSHIPLVLLTAKNTIPQEIEGLEHGADAYVKKPFDIHHLSSVIKNLLINRKKLQQKFSTSMVVSPDSLKDKETPNDKFILSVLNLIEKNLSNSEYTIEQLASDIGMSSVHLYRKIKALTGLTTINFIRNYKMKKAAQLLTDKKLRVSEAAYEVGYSDPKYFRKCFKLVFNINPTEYIAEHKGKNA